VSGPSPADRTARVWAIVVHYGDPATTAATVASLRGAERAPDVVLVVDNQGDFRGDDETRVVRMETNVGFAGAAAVGAGEALRADADWLWFVNTDADVAPGCLTELLAAAATDPRAALLSPVITYADDGSVWFAGGAVDERSFAATHEARVREGPAYETEYATGCALLARVESVRRIGLPDASLFLYLEDVEWSLRARASGERVIVVPAARVRHAVARRDGRRVFAPRAVYYIVRNRLVLAGRAGTVPRALPPTAAWGLRQLAKARGASEAARLACALACGLTHGLARRSGRMPPGLERRLG
jgi:GT2 family glycosyltransferase